MKFRWILQLLFIWGYLQLGSIVATLFRIPLPGSVVGMFLLFSLLLTGVMKLSWVDKVASFQLKHLTLLFIPPTAGLVLSPNFQWIFNGWILIILLISSISSLLGTAIFVEWFEKIKRRNAK
ncbi:CidA/LrgA family protein [Neobacillus endophyticus]|uniref:CidA/LrgA family protein n=1 Tax=Neobacillus endophyticus TaxID=2738405 RepID=UPI0028ABA9F8|nr:CidA/LrgA family protein [Neobacillus endophyticus]